MKVAAQPTTFGSVLQRSSRKYFVWLTVLPVLASSFAQAQLTLDVSLADNGVTIGDWHPSLISTNNGYIVNDVTYNPSGTKVTCYNMTMGIDPFISASVDVINNTASIQTYTLTFTLPISPAITGGTKIGGSTQGGVTDANGDGTGTLSTTGGAPLYYGQIDGLNVLPLFSSPFSISVPFMGGSTNVSANAGLPGPTINGPPNAFTSIGIQHQFSLTPGDRATFTSFFDVVAAVPEPGSLSLLAMGGLVLLFRRRR